MSSAKRMRAAVVREYGPPEVLRIEELPAPVPGPGQVLVDVHAAAVNYPDVLLLANRYQIPAKLPFTPGSELAGVVAALGPGVRGVEPGQRVLGSMMVGAFAEQVALPATSLTPVPEGIDLRAAAAFGVVYATAYHALRSPGRLRAGETLLVLGAGGGVGLAAVDLGRAMGARVIAAASSAAKLAAARERGAEACIDYARENLKDRLKELTQGRGVDVVIDPVGGPYSEPALRATGWRGRFVVVGFAAGEIPRIPLNLLLLKGAELHSLNIGPFGEREPEEAARNRAELLELWRAGKISPHVSSVYPLARAAEALRELAERRAIGKVVIDLEA
jgi:NADPH2:quinone reductase